MKFEDEDAQGGVLRSLDGDTDHNNVIPSFDGFDPAQRNPKQNEIETEQFRSVCMPNKDRNASTFSHCCLLPLICF
jgi:hypothetical protein